ncbi:hypothetical protein ASPCADRAFT_211274 [Aspergillus carbonarius ITEM 5010]|uniref:Uncharacterized protein n=1 Tax=Aspergillus carbonarius (strain ITEM 5010) TaxID=602072 RepID=A0A1R3RAE7_ASPC5|nr:hypothetical protein ASPCADRAFT_211274 [Aspergillus carbonarius ITEM 5010]
MAHFDLWYLEYLCAIPGGQLFSHLQVSSTATISDKEIDPEALMSTSHHPESPISMEKQDARVARD